MARSGGKSAGRKRRCTAAPEGNAFNTSHFDIVCVEKVLKCTSELARIPPVRKQWVWRISRRTILCLPRFCTSLGVEKANDGRVYDRRKQTNVLL